MLVTISVYLAELDGRRVRLESQRVHERRALLCQACQGDQVLAEYINPFDTDLSTLPNVQGLSVRAVVAKRIDQYKVKRDSSLASKCAYMQRQACQESTASRARRNRTLKVMNQRRAEEKRSRSQSVRTPSNIKDPQNG